VAGHAAEEVERLITVPIETELNGLPNLVVSRSVSLYGLSNIRVTFTDGTDLYRARSRSSSVSPALAPPTA
jgi:cobalt-zinc-cadmium resistance protein CzcA